MPSTDDVADVAATRLSVRYPSFDSDREQETGCRRVTGAAFRAAR
jgi:hypothetical protein